MKIRVLAWIERGLFAAGAGLAVWCAIVVLQATKTHEIFSV
jgi:hypothetical protein